MSDFHRTSLEIAWLQLYRKTNESTVTKHLYSSLNIDPELCWLWNSVYFNDATGAARFKVRFPFTYI